MKASTHISFEILDSHKNFGEGSIDSIVQSQNGFWRSLIECPQITIRCGLKYLSEISSVKLKVENVDMVQFKAYEHNQKVFTATKLTTQIEKNGDQFLKYTFSQTKFASQVDVLLHNYSKHEKPCILSLIFYGSVDYSKPNNFPKKQKKSIRSLGSSKKEEKKGKQGGLEKQKKDGQIFDRNSFNESEVEDELCLKQANKQIKIFKIKKEYLNIFEGISEKWLESQKKMQFSECIPTQYQLSVMINPKCFHRRLFCILNVEQQVKKELIIKIKELGGFIREQPCEDCYVVTPNLVGASVGYATLMKNTKFVMPEYIRDCHQTKSLLGEKKYLPKK